MKERNTFRLTSESSSAAILPLPTEHDDDHSNINNNSNSCTNWTVMKHMRDIIMSLCLLQLLMDMEADSCSEGTSYIANPAPSNLRGARVQKLAGGAQRWKRTHKMVTGRSSAATSRQFSSSLSVTDGGWRRAREMERGGERAAITGHASPVGLEDVRVTLASPHIHNAHCHVCQHYLLQLF